MSRAGRVCPIHKQFCEDGVCPWCETTSFSQRPRGLTPGAYAALRFFLTDATEILKEIREAMRAPDGLDP